jgi:ribosome biogenesis protein MAK21
LNQLQLSRDDEEEDATTASKKKNPLKSSSTTTGAAEALPASLINTYFHLFETAVQKDPSIKKKGPKNNSSSLSNTDSSGMKSRLLSALLTGVNRAHPYLPRKDAVMEQHIDALYRISHTAPPAAATQALMLLFQLAVGSGEETGHEEEGKKRRVLPAKKKEEDGVTMRKDRFYRALYSKIGGGEMFSGRQLTLFFNLLYKAMKYDTSAERICAFSKRLLHSVLHQSSSIICGTLFLLSEIVKCHPEILRAESTTAEEVLFDPSKREPRAAFDGKTPSLSESLWELSLLVNHFHPSVSKFTSDSDGKISFAGDPLKDFSLAPFLDKFAFRNPKSVNKAKRGVEGIAGRKTLPAKSTGLPMNDPSFLESENVSAEEKFFHQFFVERAKRDEIKGVVRGNDRTKDRDDEEDEALDAAEKVADEVSSYILMPH